MKPLQLSSWITGVFRWSSEGSSRGTGMVEAFWRSLWFIHDRTWLSVRVNIAKSIFLNHFYSGPKLLIVAGLQIWTFTYDVPVPPALAIWGRHMTQEEVGERNGFLHTHVAYLQQVWPLLRTRQRKDPEKWKFKSNKPIFSTPKTKQMFKLTISRLSPPIINPRPMPWGSLCMRKRLRWRKKNIP